MSQRSRLIVVLSLVLLTTGCLGAVTGGGDGGGNDTVDRVQSRSLEAMQDVDTYRMTMELTSEVRDGRVNVSFDGVFDREAKSLRGESYVSGIDGLLYLRGVEPEVDGKDVLVYGHRTMRYYRVDGEWYRTQIARGDFWSTYEGLERQRYLLNHTDPTLVRNTTLDGEEVYVLETNSSRDQYRETSRILDGVSMLRLNANDVNEITLTQYVDKESYRVRKTEIEVSYRWGGQNLTLESVTTFSDYGSPVDITIPDEATDVFAG